MGDGGFIKDQITAQGIEDAFLQAERRVIDLDECFGGSRPYGEAMADFQRARDENAMAMYELTCHIAMLEPPPTEMRQLFGAICGKQQAMDGFVQMNAGTISPVEFMSPENIERIMV